MIVPVNCSSVKGQNIFTIKTALGFLSCLQCWMPARTVVSFNDILATGEFIN